MIKYEVDFQSSHFQITTSAQLHLMIPKHLISLNIKRPHHWIVFCTPHPNIKCDLRSWLKKVLALGFATYCNKVVIKHQSHADTLTLQQQSSLRGWLLQSVMFVAAPVFRRFSVKKKKKKKNIKTMMYNFLHFQSHKDRVCFWLDY